MSGFEWKRDFVVCACTAHVDGQLIGFVQQDNDMPTARWVMYASLPPGGDILSGRSRSVKAAKQALRERASKLLIPTGACAVQDAAAS